MISRKSTQKMCKTKPERIAWIEGGREKKKTGDTERNGQIISK